MKINKKKANGQRGFIPIVSYDILTYPGLSGNVSGVEKAIAKIICRGKKTTDGKIPILELWFSAADAALNPPQYNESRMEGVLFFHEAAFGGMLQVVTAKNVKIAVAEGALKFIGLYVSNV